MTERELLVFLANNFRKWHGKPKETAPGTEEHFTPLGEVWNAINASGESFSPMFVLNLFSLLQQVAESGERLSDEYGRFYKDPEKTLDELKREHDLKGFNQKLAKPRMDAANITNKKKRAKSKKPDALKVWGEWQKQGKAPTEFFDFCMREYKVSRSTAERWIGWRS